MISSLPITLLLILTLFTSAGGQQESNKNAPTFYLLPDFSDAKILFKSGSEKQAVFNYNVVTEEMVYDKNGRFMALDMPGIDTIYIAGKKFVPFGKVFYEVVQTPPGLLFIRHYNKLASKGKPAGYGGYTQTAATTSLSSLNVNGNLYSLEVPSNYKLSDQTSFLISKGRQFHEVNSTRQLMKAFPEKKSVIKELVKENRTDFKKPKDVLEVLQVLQ